MAPHYWVFEVWIFLLILILYYAGRQAGSSIQKDTTSSSPISFLVGTVLLAVAPPEPCPLLMLQMP